MAQDEYTLESLIKGGLIGAALGAILAKDKEEGAMVGALLGAAISATLQAGEEAKKTNIPLYEMENGMLYEVLPSGEKRFIKTIRTSARPHLPDRFTLK